MADGLSRILFRDPNGAATTMLARIQRELDAWRWMNGKDSYKHGTNRRRSRFARRSVPSGCSHRTSLKLRAKNNVQKTSIHGVYYDLSAKPISLTDPHCASASILPNSFTIRMEHESSRFGTNINCMETWGRGGT